MRHRRKGKIKSRAVPVLIPMLRMGFAAAQRSIGETTTKTLRGIEAAVCDGRMRFEQQQMWR
jgi:hypothetical protein